MGNIATFRKTWRKHGYQVALIKSLGRMLGRRAMVEGVDRDVGAAVAKQDLSMPTMDDADKTHSGYGRWKHVLPLPNDRMMLHIGAVTVENFYVVADAWGQVLSRFIKPGSHVMDVGCGCGRTARILVNNPNVVKFTGFDVVKPYIAWCNRYFGAIYSDRFKFYCLDVKTDRYNPNGLLSSETARFPAAAEEIDFVYAASLFTHMYLADLKSYVAEMHRVLKPGGLAVISIHDQPKQGEQFSGSEHRVDYDAAYFILLMRKFGFVLVEDVGELCGQRTFVFKKN
jgi:SAM-dependent methyltransferase